jgi:hypothetical protein
MAAPMIQAFTPAGSLFGAEKVVVVRGDVVVVVLPEAVADEVEKATTRFDDGAKR